MEKKYVFKDVWLKNDATAERDAIAIWSGVGVLPASADPRQRAKELCIAVYDGDELIGISTCTIAYFAPVRQKMAISRMFIVRHRRNERLAIPLTGETFKAMERYALANPNVRLGGLGGVVEVKGILHKPHTAEDMILIGYTQENDPILVRWFDHFALAPGES
jgi:hypothetical protein